MHIVILDDYQDTVRQLDCFRKLSRHQVSVYNDTPDDMETVVRRLVDADAVVLIRERTAITGALLERLPNLKLISQTGKISNHLDLDACNAHNIPVAEGVGSPVAPAELCWTLILAASRQLVPYCTRLRAGEWQNSGSVGLGRSLKGLTLGIWGYGKIGRNIANYGRAFGMEVLVWGRDASRQAAIENGYAAAESRARLFEESDVLSLHLRLNDVTRGAVAREDLERMKPDALFVNMSRAELVREGALESALAIGRPGFAAVDVYEREPVADGGHPLLAMDNVLCSPHIGYVTSGSYELYFNAAFDNILAFASGRPQNIANPQVLAS